MIRIEALGTNGQLNTIRIYVDAADAEKMPKSVRIHPTYLQACINFGSNGANQGANETGARRMRSLLKNADKHGIGVVFYQHARVNDPLNAPLWGTGLGQMVRTGVEAALDAITA